MRRVCRLAIVLASASCTTAPRPRVPAPEEAVVACRARVRKLVAERASASRSASRRRYEVPTWWEASRRELSVGWILGSVGRPRLREGAIDEVVVDHSRGIVDVHANQTGHEEVIRALGGCVLYPDDESADRSIHVQSLRHARAKEVTEALGAAIAPVRATADESTQSVVLTGPAEEIARALTLVETIDCIVGVSHVSPARGLRAAELR